MIFITQGRFTRDAMTGMAERPEDRATAVAKLAKATGGKLLAYYFTFGEYDFLSVFEGEDPQKMASALIVAAASGGVTDLKTTIGITLADAKKAFAGAKDVIGNAFWWPGRSSTAGPLPLPPFRCRGAWPARKARWLHPQAFLNGSQDVTCHSQSDKPADAAHIAAQQRLDHG